MLPQLTCAHASQCNCSVSRYSHVHVKYVIGIDIDDFFHLIVKFIQKSEREHCLARFLADTCTHLVCTVALSLPLLIPDLGGPALEIHLCLFTFVAVALVVLDHPVGIAREQELVIFGELDASNTGSVIIDYVNGTCLLLTELKNPYLVVQVAADV